MSNPTPEALSIASLIAKAQAGESKEPRLRDSRGEVSLSKIEIRNGMKGNSVLMTFCVDACEKVAVQSAKTNQPEDIAPHTPGEKFIVVSNLSKGVAVLAYLKKTFCALLGVNPSEVKDAELLEAIANMSTPEQKGKGLKLRYYTKRVMTKTGIEITVPEWSSIPQDAKAVKTNRERLEKAGF